MTAPTVQLLAEWTRARAALRELERTEHPDITDPHGRVWTWVDGDLYEHDETLAFPADRIPGAGLPSPALADNPNYHRLCSICRSQWPTTS